LHVRSLSWKSPFKDTPCPDFIRLSALWNEGKGLFQVDESLERNPLSLRRVFCPVKAESLINIYKAHCLNRSEDPFKTLSGQGRGLFWALFRVFQTELTTRHKKGKRWGSKQSSASCCSVLRCVVLCRSVLQWKELGF